MEQRTVSPDAVVIGIGCPYRRDDGVGPAVLDRLAAMWAGDRRFSDFPALVTCDGDVTRLIGIWERAASAVVVDAAQSVGLGRPGTVRRFDLADTELQHGPLPASSHGLGLAEAVALAHALGRLPARLVVYTVEAADTGVGNGLSPDVAAAVDEAAGRVAAEIARNDFAAGSAGDPSIDRRVRGAAGQQTSA